jgi:hypothetical protein
MLPRKYRGQYAGGFNNSFFVFFRSRTNFIFMLILLILFIWVRSLFTSDLIHNLLYGSPATIMSAVEEAAVSAAKPFTAVSASTTTTTTTTSTSSSSSLSTKMRQASRLGKSKIEDRVKNGLSSLEKTIRVTNTLPISTTSITNTIKMSDERKENLSIEEQSEMKQDSTSSSTSKLLPVIGLNIHEIDPFFGSQIDLDGHKANDQCWEHFDFGMLEDWDAKNEIFCAPILSDGNTDILLKANDLLPPNFEQDNTQTDIDQKQTIIRKTYQDDNLSWLRCRVTVDSHLPPPTAPHTMCDGANIVFDASLLQPTHCLDSRSGYKCDGPPIHWRFFRGAFSPRNPNGCKVMPSFIPTSFPQDHLRDMFSSFSSTFAQSSSQLLTSSSSTIGKVVLLFARERAEHANPFHATTDFMNAFFSLHLAGVLSGIKGSRKGIENVQVILLDEQVGPYDTDFISTVFSPNFEILRVSSMQTSGKTKILLPHAIFSPPGYSNFFLAHVDSEGDCHAGTQLLQSFRQFVLSAFPSTMSLLIPKFSNPLTDPIIVTLISRRPYDRFVQHSFIGRQIDNEDELISALSSEPGVIVTRHDFAQFKSVEEQLAVIAKTEVLVAMHGAALTYAIYLPAHASVLEFWPKAIDMWRCFEHIAAMSGLQYLRWANPDPSAFRTDVNGDYTRIDITEVSKKFSELVQGARERRTAKRK